MKKVEKKTFNLLLLMICAAWKEKKKNFQGYFSISGKCLK
jgi:hypothetical protein